MRVCMTTLDEVLNKINEKAKSDQLEGMHS